MEREGDRGRVGRKDEGGERFSQELPEHRKEESLNGPVKR